MGLPSVAISFTTAAGSAIKRSQKGVVAAIVRDSAAGGAHLLFSAKEIPAALSKDNQDYLTRAFTGYVDTPKKVVAYVLAPEGETPAEIGEALDYLATQTFDYLVAPPDVTAEECGKVAAWIQAQRENGIMVKAVLPNHAADSEAVVNFATEKIVAGGKEYTTAEYCSRIAGLLVGTPLTIASTYAPLPEVTDVSRKPKRELDEDCDQGKLVLFFDGTKVKVGRGVTSYITTTPEKGKAFQKIKIVEAMDLIKTDIRQVSQDTYIGKYPNSYDNKCLLITSIKEYLERLEQEGVLMPGSAQVEIDLDEQRGYLQDQGMSVAEMTDQEIKTANTGDKVFLKASMKVLDAIEDISLDIRI